jgi:hypothetical protein
MLFISGDECLTSHLHLLGSTSEHELTFSLPSWERPLDHSPLHAWDRPSLPPNLLPLEGNLEPRVCKDAHACYPVKISSFWKCALLPLRGRCLIRTNVFKAYPIGLLTAVVETRTRQCARVPNSAPRTAACATGWRMEERRTEKTGFCPCAAPW